MFVLLLRKLLFPFSLLYGLVVHLRNWCYDKGIFHSNDFSVPIICIGNLSVGGTGKTPMVEFLLQHLFTDKKVAVLSRGYKRKSKGFVLAGADTTVQELGDEPYQIFSKFKDQGVAVAVEADRAKGVEHLMTKVGPKVILMDDAYQHRKVTPTFSILLTQYARPYWDDWYLPTGNLRDSKGAAQRAQVIVVTKCPKDLSLQQAEWIREKRTLGKGQKLLFASLAYGPYFMSGKDQLSFEQAGKRKITLVTGIADPGPLVRHLTECGLSFEHLAYGDHHFFSKKELEELKKKELVLTTEKDYVRLKEHVADLFYLPVRHVFLFQGDEVLRDSLQAAIPFL